MSSVCGLPLVYTLQIRVVADSELVQSDCLHFVSPCLGLVHARRAQLLGAINATQNVR